VVFDEIGHEIGGKIGHEITPTTNTRKVCGSVAVGGVGGGVVSGAVGGGMRAKLSV
jgi:hypothetical protein